jgi:hypothetical protein
VGGRIKWRSFAIFAAIALALVAAWRLVPQWLIPSSEVHYKLSVDVDDNGVLRHGEGVIGVAFQSQGPLLIGNTPQWSVSAFGEAFGVNIGDRGTLYVLLVGDGPRERRDRIAQGEKVIGSASAGPGALWGYFGFDVTGLPNGRETKAKIDAFATSKASVELPPSALPLLVRFRDPKDPSTVEVVDPDSLEASFGSGVKISLAHATIVDEPVTWGIIKERLSWLKLGYREKYLFTLSFGPGSAVPAPQDITYGDFSTSTK